MPQAQAKARYISTLVLLLPDHRDLISQSIQSLKM